MMRLPRRPLRHAPWVWLMVALVAVQSLWPAWAHLRLQDPDAIFRELCSASARPAVGPAQDDRPSSDLMQAAHCMACPLNIWAGALPVPPSGLSAVALHAPVQETAPPWRPDPSPPPAAHRWLAWWADRTLSPPTHG